MKKLISILSMILLVGTFSIPCASGDEPVEKDPIKIKAKNVVKFKPGKGPSLESSSLKETVDGYNRYQRKHMNMSGGGIDNSLDSSLVGFGTFNKKKEKERKGQNAGPD